MAKVKCKVCANEVSGICDVKKIGVKINKKRNCEAYIYDEAKVKSKSEINVTRVGYRQMQENKLRMKAELKELKKALKEGQKNGTAVDLGLIQPVENKIIQPGDPNFTMPNTSTKHPLTGDLSRFTTTADNEE
jgi:hypothetical protein